MQRRWPRRLQPTCYTWRVMFDKQNILASAGRLLLCLWMVATQVWYYAQYRTLFGAFARAFLR